jgi:DNA helicase-2/ATP-dependent DNA helicase PcrA
VAFKRVARLLPGIGPAAAARMWREFHDRLKADLGSPQGRLLPTESRGVPKKAAGDWKHVATVLNDLRGLTDDNIDEMIELVIEGYYQGYLEAKYPNARSRLEDLFQLASFGLQFPSVEEFLSQLALLTNLEADDASLLASGDREFVRLSTVHQAKGQEWEAVFVVGLCDGMFPLARALETEDGAEEERRLFYVAVTRAKNELFMTYPLMKAGGRVDSLGGGGFQRPSRFVADLPPEKYQELSLRYQGRGW